MSYYETYNYVSSTPTPTDTYSLTTNATNASYVTMDMFRQNSKRRQHVVDIIGAKLIQVKKDFIKYVEALETKLYKETLKRESLQKELDRLNERPLIKHLKLLKKEITRMEEEADEEYRKSEKEKTKLIQRLQELTGRNKFLEKENKSFLNRIKHLEGESLEDRLRPGKCPNLKERIAAMELE